MSASAPEGFHSQNDSVQGSESDGAASCGFFFFVCFFFFFFVSLLFLYCFPATYMFTVCACLIDSPASLTCFVFEILVTGSLRRTASVSDYRTTEKRPDPVREVCDLQVKIADLGNACWVVSLSAPVVH